MNKYIALAITLAITSAECFARGGYTAYSPHKHMNGLETALLVIVMVPLIAVLCWGLAKGYYYIMQDVVKAFKDNFKNL